ncbi:hypothetical protein PTT_00525 [Pyrenophora teres f. teres 0-1]|uniref:N-acetyltransferase domain-containing protein n=2 Tax=Pyrenophora teres f. teres TaxID=97479 RepID=E3RCJ5_PYRTT|nr:hypothetical protein PTT_00525 [Pyrenophora teres f. teres 0-1]
MQDEVNPLLLLSLSLLPFLILHSLLAFHAPNHRYTQDLQTLTASSPLSLAEEYSMCASWRSDADKLTFIICTCAPASTSLPAPSSAESSTLQENAAVVTPGAHDAPENMIGDVNLFLYPYEDESEDEEQEGNKEDVIGELEIMIAPPSARGKGYAKEALEAFLWYIKRSVTALLDEYGSADSKPESEEKTKQKEKMGMGEKIRLRYLRVKINKDNVKSLGLFEKMGFKRVGGGPNYFGEVEMRVGMDGHGEEKMGEKEGNGFTQLPYGNVHGRIHV